MIAIIALVATIAIVVVITVIAKIATIAIIAIIARFTILAKITVEAGHLTVCLYKSSSSSRPRISLASD